MFLVKMQYSDLGLSKVWPEELKTYSKTAHGPKNLPTLACIRAVIPKVCSADHWWSARLAEVVRESLYKPIFCPSRTTEFF